MGQTVITLYRSQHCDCAASKGTRASKRSKCGISRVDVSRRYPVAVKHTGAF